MRRQRVGASGAVDEHRRLQAPSTGERLKGVAALVGERARLDVVALRRAHPAAGGQHHGHRLVGDEARLIDRLGRLALDDLGAPLVAIRFRIGADLGGDELPELRLALQQRLELLALSRERLLLLADSHLLEPGQMPQARVEDLLGLLIGELEALHQQRLGLVLAADDTDHLVQIEEGDEQAIEDVQPLADLVQAVLQAARDGRGAEFEPLAQDLLQAHHPRAAVERDDVEIDAVVALQVGGGEQVVHELHQIDAVGARHDDQPRRILVIGLVAQVLHHRQLLGAHLLGDLLLHARRRHLVGKRRDDDVAVLDLPGGARLESADALVVELLQVRARGNDLGARRQVRALDVLHERGGRGFRVLQQVDCGRGDLAQVMRRNVGRHADRDARRAIQQQVRQPRRQEHRLFQRAVEIGRPVHRAVGEFPEQHVGVPGELRLGVAHRGEGLGVILRAPVALAVDERIAIGEGLRHQHHGLIAGRVAVRMELAEDIPDGARGLLVLGDRRQPELAHGVHDAPLYRLQPVAECRQRAIENDVHRVIEVGLLGEGAQRLALDAFEVQFLILRHAYTCTCARLPFSSSHSRRSAARFLASSMSMS